MSTKEIGASTTMMIILFGVNACLYLFFQYINYFEKKDVREDGKANPDAPKKKELSKPFTLTLDGFTKLTTDVMWLGGIMALTYICENHWIFEHSQKEYSRDLFLFIVILFFIYGYYTMEPVKDLSLLSRDQTEEWKGWMQFIFLLYHYFHAEEVYNSVRIMITCYVWMTGFGNFSFFYIKKDFGWLRVAQMLWRLNFTVLFLMWTHGNTYILYYICPLHTFYFCLVYATMFCYSSVNHSKWGIRAKLMIVGILIFVVWDFNSNIFDMIFGWVLGTDSIIGAKKGSLWEYYFRTSLDHYSSFLGMIFALNFPLAEQYFIKATSDKQRFPIGLLVTGLCLGGLCVYWYINVYCLPKLEYNLLHSYWAIVPLTSYIFFRNLTPGIRSYVSMSLHALGKTTLETYLLQHHIWLTSNAKTLLTIVPNSPYVNFIFATALFYVCSKKLYGLTMTLRGMIIPDDSKLAITNISGMIAVLMCCGFVAFILHSLHWVSLFSALLCSCCLFIGLLYAIKAYCPSLQSLSAFSSNFQRSINFTYIAMAICVVGHIIVVSSSTTSSSGSHRLLTTATPSTATSLEFDFDANLCANGITEGYWVTESCDLEMNRNRSLVSKVVEDWEEAAIMDTMSVEKDPLSFIHLSDSFHHRDLSIASSITTRPNPNAFCQKNTWRWSSDILSKCPYRGYGMEDMTSSLKNKHVIFVGDSITRATYHGFVGLLDRKYDPLLAVEQATMDFKTQTTNPTAFKHIPLTHVVQGSNIEIKFVWAPTLSELSDVFEKLDETQYDILVSGVALWDALYTHDVDVFKTQLEKLRIPTSKALTTIWLSPSSIIDLRLNTDSKRQFMTEAQVEPYRAAIKNSINIRHHVDLIIDPSRTITPLHGKESIPNTHITTSSIDGVHYGEEVYGVVGQLIYNGIALKRKLSADMHRVFTTPAPQVVSQSTSNTSEHYKPKPTGSMSFVTPGLFVLLLAAVMLFTMDSFFGLGYLGLLIGGKHYDYDEAYAPLLAKINPSTPASVNTITSNMDGKDHAGVDVDYPSNANATQEIEPDVDAEEMEMLLNANKKKVEV